MHAGLCQAKGWTPLGNMYPHWSVYGKICPILIIQAGEWPAVEQEATVLFSQIEAFLTGKDIGKAAEEAIDAWPYPEAVPPSFWEELHLSGVTHVRDNGMLWFRANSHYAVKTGTARQQFAIQDDRVVGPELEPGTIFHSFTIGESISDRQPWVITPMMTRVHMDDLIYVPEDDDADPALVVAALQNVLDSTTTIDNS